MALSVSYNMQLTVDTSVHVTVLSAEGDFLNIYTEHIYSNKSVPESEQYLSEQYTT